jgi:lipopolysaccharide export system ATP-binding protein
MIVLRSEHLVKVYKSRAVVNDVSVEVKQGEIVGLLGPNGAGKTTSFYMIVGLVPPDKGKIFLSDTELTSLPMYRRSQLGVGYLPQEASVFRNLSVEDNISAVLEMTGLRKAEQKDRLELLLNEFGLNRVRGSMGNVLSGGERRRTEIARALATDPKFILLDEPFAGIDPIAVEDIQRIVEKLKQRNIGVLITDHNVRETLSITDRAYLLFEGKILKQGNAEELANDPVVRKVYLGQNFELKKRGVIDDSPEQILSDEQQKLMRYTNDLIEFSERLLSIANGVNSTNRLKSELEVAGYSEFIASVKEYKNFLTQSSYTGNNSLIMQKVSGLSVLEINQSVLSTFSEVFKIGEWSSAISSLVSGTNMYSDYLWEIKSGLQQISYLLLTGEVVQ